MAALPKDSDPELLLIFVEVKKLRSGRKKGIEGVKRGLASCCFKKSLGGPEEAKYVQVRIAE